jgi:predicted lipid carrier protein YhbT
LPLNYQHRKFRMFPIPPRAIRVRVQPLAHLFMRGIFQAPFPLQQIALEQVLQQVFKEPIQEGEWDFLTGHFLKIHIIDMERVWYFTHLNGKIRVYREAPQSVTIRGDLKDFLQLALGCVDPDTLFFQRRLAIEGDTELGLQIKNLLDNIDIETLPLPLRRGMEFTSQFICTNSTTTTNQ